MLKDENEIVGPIRRGYGWRGLERNDGCVQAAGSSVSQSVPAKVGACSDVKRGRKPVEGIILLYTYIYFPQSQAPAAQPQSVPQSQLSDPQEGGIFTFSVLRFFGIRGLVNRRWRRCIQELLGAVRKRRGKMRGGQLPFIYLHQGLNPN
jgi:hypothetical protein